MCSIRATLLCSVLSLLRNKATPKTLLVGVNAALFEEVPSEIDIHRGYPFQAMCCSVVVVVARRDIVVSSVSSKFHF